MSYASKDVQTSGAKVVLLFQFQQGGTVYRYVNQSHSITFDGMVWSPSIIVPDKFASSAEVLKNTLNLRVALSETLAQSFIGYPPDVVTSVTVFRAIIGETDKRFYWKGKVTNSGVSKAEVSLDCEPMSSSMKKTGLRARVMRVCGHTLYGPGCNLSEATYSKSVTVTAVSKATVTIPELSASFVLNGTTFTPSSNPFRGGIITAPDGTRRTIANQAGAALTLMRPLAGLASALAASPEGITVSVSLGCPHDVGSCVVRFHNAGNCIAFACLPTRNPFQTPMS
jgi:hypothetical protein